MTTRQTTSDGFVRSGAVLTRAGIFEYQARELGLPGDPERMVTVRRTMESLRHPETLDSLRGAPVTLGHPVADLSPANWREHVVGSVAGEPRVSANAVLGDLLIGDAGALAALDGGKREISIGYDMAVRSDTTGAADYETVGPMPVNHVALIPEGRAGHAVRVLDRHPDRSDAMDVEEISKAVRDALAGQQQVMQPDAVARAVTDALEPIWNALQRQREEDDARAALARQEQAEADARKAADDLRSEVIREERERAAVVADALPLVPHDQRAGLVDSDAHSILVAALGDELPDAQERSVGELRMFLAGRKVRADATPDGLPPGISRNLGSVNDERKSALDEFIAAQARVYADAGGR